MKASNPQVMVQAYRLLVAKMEEEGMNYPLHLGVTEAGEGEDGRIKSSVGIGTLLEDGLGDTIRVSLTEEPEVEIPVAIKLVNRYNNRTPHKEIPYVITNPIDPFERTKRHTYETDKIGGSNVPVVIVTPDLNTVSKAENLSDISYNYNSELDKWNIGDTAPDFIYLASGDVHYALPGTLKKIFGYKFWLKHEDNSVSFPLFTAEEFLNAEKRSDRINFLSVSIEDLTGEIYKAISDDSHCVIVLSTSNRHGMAEERRVFIELMNRGIDAPVIIKRRYENLGNEDLILYSSTDFGALLLDGLGDGVWIESQDNSIKFINNISFGILQATRTRISRTEYISCPSCGRTQFDLQITTAKIRKRTDHLKGVKIAIMGCIVNGPGEMADADFGYVGSGPGKISLYKGKEVVERGINEDVAVDKLIELIKKEGMWADS